MGLDAAWRKMKQTARDLNDARNLRLSDPRIKARLDHQRDKTRDSFYSMGRQAQNVATSAVFDLALKTMLPGERTKKGKRQALIQACMTLAEAAKLGADLYFITDVYALAKNQINELSITDDDFKSITTNVAASMRLDGTALKKYEGWIRELSEYEVIDRFNPNQHGS